MLARIAKPFRRFAARLGKARRKYMAARPHRSFRKTRTPLKRPVLATVKQNALGTFALLWAERKLLFLLSLVYIVASHIFIGGVAQADFVELKEATVEVLGGSLNSAGTVFSLLTSAMSGVFSAELTELQQFLGILVGAFFWLSIIWLLRMRLAGRPIKMRDALYNSGAPVVSYLIVGFFAVMQLTPGAVGLFILNFAQGGGFLQGGVEVMMFAVGALLLCALSVYWISGSLVALVIVTLPQMYPWRAVQIAGELAVGRRVRLLGHMAALTCIVFLGWAAVLLPALFVDSWLRWEWLPLVPLALQALSAWSILYVAAYVYKLYRSML